MKYKIITGIIILFILTNCKNKNDEEIKFNENSDTQIEYIEKIEYIDRIEYIQDFYYDLTYFLFRDKEKTINYSLYGKEIIARITNINIDVLYGESDHEIFKYYKILHLNIEHEDIENWGINNLKFLVDDRIQINNLEDFPYMKSINKEDLPILTLSAKLLNEVNETHDFDGIYYAIIDIYLIKDLIKINIEYVPLNYGGGYF